VKFGRTAQQNRLAHDPGEGDHSENRRSAKSRRVALNVIEIFPLLRLDCLAYNACNASYNWWMPEKPWPQYFASSSVLTIPDNGSILHFV